MRGEAQNPHIDISRADGARCSCLGIPDFAAAWAARAYGERAQRGLSGAELVEAPRAARSAATDIV